MMSSQLINRRSRNDKNARVKICKPYKRYVCFFFLLEILNTECCARTRRNHKHVCDSPEQAVGKQVLSELTLVSSLVNAAFRFSRTHEFKCNCTNWFKKNKKIPSSNTPTFTKQHCQATPSAYTPPFCDWTIPRKTIVWVTCFWRMFTNRRRAEQRERSREREDSLPAPSASSRQLARRFSAWRSGVSICFYLKCINLFFLFFFFFCPSSRFSWKVASVVWYLLW